MIHRLVAFFLTCASFTQAETILFYGNSLAERLLENGKMEALLQLSSDRDLHIRSLAWTGDEVGCRLRPEGYPAYMTHLVETWPADIVVAAYGTTESFEGEKGLPKFHAEYAAHIRQLKAIHPGARLVLLSPLANPDRAHDIDVYAEEIKKIAAESGAQFIDLETPTKPAPDQALDTAATVIARSLAGDNVNHVDAARVKEISAAASQKHHFIAEVVRPKNAALYYGVRKRPEEFAAEIPRYFALVDQADAILHELLKVPGKKISDFPAPSLPPLPAIAGSDDGKKTGVIKSPADAMAEFQVADGYEVNLFASEKEFPDLKNPVQIAFDAKGRLWAVTMPSFPHMVPGLKPNDKIVVLEDTDHNGKADKLTVYADGFDALDGVAFHKDGVIISEQPRLWMTRDTDGDGRMDEKRELLRGIDVTDSHHGGMIATDPSGGVMFCDGVFHRSQLETPFGIVRGIDSTTYRLHVATGRVETEYQSITPNPWKITFDRYGNIFQMYGDGVALDELQLTWTPLGVYHPFSLGSVLGYGKGSGVQVVSSPNFPEEYQQGLASAALLGNYAVSLTKVDMEKGPAKGSDRLDLLSSPNAAFRPVDLGFGPDGALYVSDFCSPIIGHAQHAMRDPHWDHDHGRIWRVVNRAKPLVKDWPKIEGASAKELCALLTSPQDLIRKHARIELAKNAPASLETLDSWIAGFDRAAETFPQAALEALFVCENAGQTRPALLSEVLKSPSALHRAAVVHLIRLQAERLPDAVALLSTVQHDASPRVLMELVDAIAHLRPRFPAVEQLLNGLASDDRTVKRMLADLRHGVKPHAAHSVPVLTIAPESQLKLWQFLGDQPSVWDASSNTSPGPGTYRAFVDAAEPQIAVLAVKSGYVDISLNGTQILSQNTQWSSDQQVPLNLKKGLNTIDVTFLKVRKGVPPVHLFNQVGEPLKNVAVANTEAALNEIAKTYAASQGNESDLHIQTVPNQLQFTPAKIHVKAGAKITLQFENPDVMLHNLVLCAPGSTEKVGAAADALAAKPEGMDKAFIPDIPLVLAATKLINPGEKATLEFTVPDKPGEYPFLCTFPGHWRVMRGVLIAD